MSRNLKAKKFHPKISRSFQSALKYAQANKDVEKAVEKATCNLLEEGLTVYAGNVAHTHYPHKTDGVVTVTNGLFGDMSILVEAKRDSGDLSQPKSRAVVIAQSVFYLKRFKDAGDLIPSALVFADMDQVFALPTSLVINYLDGVWGEVSEGWNWSLSPSGVSKHSVRLVEALSTDSNLRPFVRPVDDSFDAEAFISSVYDMASTGEPIKIPVTALTLEKLFLKFNQNVFGGILNAKTQGDTVSNQDQISVFIASLKGSDSTYLHPKQPNVLVHGKKSVRLNSDAYEAFWNHYDSASYNLDEIKAITEIADTLINDVDRRFHGDFWTPVIWVNKAHEMITESLGEDWKDNYTVWDPACGSKNLTRDYYFNNLYLSTLHEEELEISSDYNPEASGEHTFAYDFLNDDVDVMHGENAYTRDQMEAMSDEELSRTFKMPVSLIRDFLAKKPFVFIGNPPYGQATSGQGRDHKNGVSATKTGALMDGMGHARMEMYTQFIYRVQLLAKKFGYTDQDSLHFFFFFNKGFLTSPNFKIFTQGLTEQFHFNNGFMINAGEFNGTSSAWGIIFSHWSLKGEKNQDNFNFDVLKSINNEIERLTVWNGIVPNSAKSTIMDWLKEIMWDGGPAELPISTNGLDPADPEKLHVIAIDNSFGYMLGNGSNIQGSDKYTSMNSIFISRGHGRLIGIPNLIRIIMTFSIRRSVQEDIAEHKLLWVRDKDIFTAPSDELSEDKVFTADCMAYSLFDRQSNQTSLRNFEYNGNSYRVINEFFPFSRDFIKNLAVQHRNLKVQQDVSVETKERIVYNWLQENEEYLSDEARALLSIAKNIYEVSFVSRADYDHMHPRYQVQSWDAGWMQINRMVFGNDRISDEYLHLKPDFIAARKTLGKKIAQAAYDDGIIAGIEKT